MPRKIGIISLLLVLIVDLISTGVLIAVYSTPGGNGALLTLKGQTVHVVWQFRIEYDSTEMVEAIDNLHEALRYNEDRMVEDQLETLITDALRKTNSNLVCKDSKILLDTNIHTWANVLLEFDVEGAVTTEGDNLIVDLSWRAFTVKDKVKYFRDRVEYSFYPRKALALKWPFESDVNTWSIDYSVQGQNVISTSFTNAYRQGVEIISDVTLKPVNMTVTVPGSATAGRDYIRVPKESSQSGQTASGQDSTNLYIILGVVSAIGLATIFGALYLWRRQGISVGPLATVSSRVTEGDVVKFMNPIRRILLPSSTMGKVV